MLQRIIIGLIVLLALSGTITAQNTPNTATFTPRESILSFDYPVEWQVREIGRVVAIVSDESALALEINQTVPSGQVKILMTYLTPEQRASINLSGDTPEAILESALHRSNIAIETSQFTRYEFDRRLSIRSDFSTDLNSGSIWVMQMPDSAVVLVQVLTAPAEISAIENRVIELLRSVDISPIFQQLFDINTIERPLRFISEKSRLLFTYPDGWRIQEDNPNTILMINDENRTQIAIRFYNYTDLKREGVPIDDPSAVLINLHQRSNRAGLFGDIRQIVVNGETLPYAEIRGQDISGLSLGRDIDIGMLWVSILTPGQTLPRDLSTLTWAILLTSSYRPQPVELDQRVIMPQHQLEFFMPTSWLSRRVNDSSYLLGTSDAMIDDDADAILVSGDAQLLVQYVTPSEIGLAGAGDNSPRAILQRFITRASDTTVYKNMRDIIFGSLTYTQVDFDSAGFSGTALLSRLEDGGAIWIQLRTALGEVGQWEQVALAIARSARIVTAPVIEGGLDTTVFDLLDIQPTPIPTPTPDPSAPPVLGDVLGEIIATPVTAPVRNLNFTLPELAGTYTTNFSDLTVNYPADWLLQEEFPTSDASPDFENSLRLANKSAYLLNDRDELEPGATQITVQYTRYDEIAKLGFRGDTLMELTQSIITAFPQGGLGTPTQYRINGDLMIIVQIQFGNRQGLSILRELSDAGYVTVQVFVHPSELEMWLPTALAIAQSARIETE